MSMLIDSYRFGAAGGFSPDEIAGLVGWWDASDVTTITESGGAVSQWNDKSASGNNVVQAGSNKPATAVNTQNGLNVLTFASGDLLRVTPSAAIGASAVSIFVVFRKTGAANTFESFPLTLTAGSAGRPFDGYQGTRITAGFTRSGYTNIATQTSWCQLSMMTYTAAGNVTWLERKDGTQVKTETSTTTWGGTASQVITIASRGDGVTKLTGDVAEILVYDAQLTGTDLTDVETYLADKWGTP
jgi:hypothetical protein